MPRLNGSIKTLKNLSDCITKVNDMITMNVNPFTREVLTVNRTPVERGHQRYKRFVQTDAIQKKTKWGSKRGNKALKIHLKAMRNLTKVGDR